MRKNNVQTASFSVFSEMTSETSYHEERLTGKGFILITGRRVDLIEGIDITAPFLLENIHILRLRGGSLTISINLMKHTFTEGDLLLIGPGTIYQIEQYTSTTLSDILVIDIDTARQIFRDTLPTFLSDTPVFIATKPDGEKLELFDMLHRAIKQTIKCGMGDTTQAESLLASVIHFFSFFYERLSATENVSRQQEMFVKFLRLVRQHSREHRQIAFYADRLAVTQDHLSRTIRQHSGITCKQWIERAILLEAKVMLRHSNRTISDISYTLNFPSDSFFCKYFKRLTGMTPLQYRK